VIHKVLAPNPGPMTGPGTNTYLVDSGAGEVAVIDPGPDDPRHLQAILDRCEPMGRVAAILVTHRHADHLPAAGPLAARTGAALFGHPALPGVQRPLADGEVCSSGPGLRLEALETPGHTDDSLCYWDADQGALFTGDLVAGAGTVIVGDERGALSRYMHSLERLRDLGPRTLYPGHGPIVADGVAKLEEYLAHRRLREQQVLAGLRARGQASVDDLVGAIYPDLPPALVPMAGRNVRAHLEKLADEGRVRKTSAGWTCPNE
jgi:glyoxylase-like metal-dependent hydrolase (beta-lactamase superfamily II)